VTLALHRAIGAAVKAAISLLLLTCRPVSAQETSRSSNVGEFSFDVEEFAKSPWSFDGYLQGDLSYAGLDRDAALYRLAFLGKKKDTYRLQGGAELQAGLTFQEGPFTAYALGMLQQSHDGENWDGEALLYEGNLSWQVSANAYFTLGKTLLRWGKGYAWNPTNFVGRNKNPSDPDLSLEGFWVGLADFVKSFSGPLKTVAFTGVVLPVSADINSTFGRNHHINMAGKLYLLLHDTDIDLMALSAGSRTPRYGLTVSRNITANFEVHGEAALATDFQKRVVGADGIVTSDIHNDALSFLAGIRYLAPSNTTLICEFYYNGEGYTEKEAEDFFHFIDVADDSQLITARPDLADYQLPNFMRNYFYLKASQKEPFGWLYVTPALFTILNLHDGSFNLIPEVGYTGVENLELRSRLSLLSGVDDTEYGEKVNDWKIEFRARYFF